MWAYYPILSVSPIMMEGFLIVILSIPLADKSLQMDLYRAYNLSELHPELKIQFSHVLEGEYLTISMSQTYAAIPMSHEICICLASWGHLCILNTALYLVDKTEWCMYVLFTRSPDLIREQCLVDSHVRHANLTLNLDGYISAVSSLASDRIQVCC